ncbi:MAG TPA: hypothetical protein VH143_03295 [Kofleriaceae bacterium]|jgi:hypothetical protein|nr:hypothetical protein [Kofleriaceae bacterium]
MSVAMQTCALGCGSDGTSCATFVPSNNLEAALASAASSSLVDIPDGATIDTDAGTISGTAVTSTVITVQNQSIRVFAAPSWMLPNLRAIGTQPIAFVAAGAIEVEGVVDLSSRTTTGDGAGADTDVACHGGEVEGFGGGGGGGGGTPGGSGGGANVGYLGGVGGSVATGFSPLLGGCSGGVSGDAEGDGGGGIQLVSATSVTLAGYIDVSGAGAGSSADAGAGGGAGGMVIIESPVVVISSGGIVANGGGGAGGCGTFGADGGNGETPALGGTCSDPTRSGGNGGAGTASPQPGGNGIAGGSTGVAYGGGGGAIGRARIATGSGSYQQAAGIVMSIFVTTDTLVHD